MAQIHSSVVLFRCDDTWNQPLWSSLSKANCSQRRAVTRTGNTIHCANSIHRTPPRYAPSSCCLHSCRSASRRDDGEDRKSTMGTEYRLHSSPCCRARDLRSSFVVSKHTVLRASTYAKTLPFGLHFNDLCSQDQRINVETNHKPHLHTLCDVVFLCAFASFALQVPVWWCFVIGL